jgi:hypothetical protein
MLSSGGQHNPIDPLLLSEKLQAGPFWLLNDGLEAAGRNKLRAFWGLVFQAYAQWLLDNAVDGIRNVFIPSPTYVRDGMEACDALVCCGSSLIVLEFKASMFTAEAKYAGRPDILAEEIDKKLGGLSAGKRGIPQLAACISKLFDKKSPSKITNVDLSGVRTIYPVLVTADDLGGALVINMYLANRFRRIFNVRSIKPRKVAPLFCMSIEDLENISGYLKEAELAEILESRYRFDPSLKSSFATAENEVLARIGKRTNLALEKAFAEAMDSACERLFPGKTLDHAYLKNTSNPPQR